MILILTWFIFITLTCCITGFYFRQLLAFATGGVNPKDKSWVVYCLWGFVALSGLSQLLSLFGPVNQFTFLQYAILLAIFSIIRRRDFKTLVAYINSLLLSRILILLAAAAIIPVVIITAGPTLMDDTESYHIQMVKWIQEYGTVPGLANLHERYGFNASWFNLLAFFTPKNTNLNFFTVVNGTLSAWFSVYLISRIWSFLQKGGLQSATALLMVFAAALFCWPMIRGNASTANYDFITTAMIVVLFVEMFFTGGEERKLEKWLPELLIWPVYLCTVRVVNFPLMLLSLYAVISVWRAGRLNYLWLPISTGLILVVPFLWRNVMLSGYLLYPAYQVDLFKVDWKVKKELAIDLVHYIKYFNRVNNGFMPIEETAKMVFPGWIKTWFRYLFLYDKPIVVGGLLGYLAVVIRWKKALAFGVAFRWFMAAMVCQLICWFLIAPDPRFVYGPLLVGIFLPAWSLPVPWGRNGGKILSFLLILTTITTLGYAIIKVAGDRRYQHVFTPSALPVPPVQVIMLDGIRLHVPLPVQGNWNARCYGTELPCLYSVDPKLMLRGKSMSDGFRIGK